MIKRYAIGLVWALLFYLARNLSFPFDDVVLILDSILLGALVLKLPVRLWRVMVFVVIALPIGDLSSIYILSVFPFIIGFTTVIYKRVWKIYLLYLFIPIFLVFYWLLTTETHSYSFENGNRSLRNLALRGFSIKNKQHYKFSPDTTYLLSYWHLGCSACIRQDQALREFEKRHSGEALKLISVFLGDTMDSRFRPSLALFHQNFTNLYDDNAFLQKELGQNFGPALMLIKEGEMEKLWIAFTRDSWEARFKQFYWDWCLYND